MTAHMVWAVFLSHRKAPAMTHSENSHLTDTRFYPEAEGEIELVVFTVSIRQAMEAARRVETALCKHCGHLIHYAQHGWMHNDSGYYSCGYPYPVMPFDLAAPFIGDQEEIHQQGVEYWVLDLDTDYYLD